MCPVTIHIKDFGLSRTAEATYYKSSTKRFPIKVCTLQSPLIYSSSGLHLKPLNMPNFPPCQIFGALGKKHTNNSNFRARIVMWEIFSDGEIPYASMDNKECLEKVGSGYRMAAPEECPEELYNIMLGTDCN